MLSIIKKLFNRSTVELDNNKANFVSVIRSNQEGPKRDELFCGFISHIDFKNRELTVTIKSALCEKPIVRVVGFDSIVSASRMNDGRLRMWVTTED